MLEVQKQEADGAADGRNVADQPYRASQNNVGDMSMGFAAVVYAMGLEIIPVTVTVIVVFVFGCGCCYTEVD